VSALGGDGLGEREEKLCGVVFHSGARMGRPAGRPVV
jgi:hypothetical protein